MVTPSRIAAAVLFLGLAGPAMAECTKPEACAEATRVAESMQLDSGQYAALFEFTGVSAIDETVIIDIIIRAPLPSDQASLDGLGAMLQEALMTNMCSMEDQPALFTLGGALRLRAVNGANAPLFDIATTQC